MGQDEEAGTGEGLIPQARRDPTAFAELYRKYYDPVFRYCVHRLFERSAAEDLTSSVFMKAVQGFCRFRGDEKDFRNREGLICSASVLQTRPC